MISIDELRKLGRPYNMGYGVIRLPFTTANTRYSYQFYFDAAECATMPPHQHRYSFTSIVKSGALRNDIYEVTGTNPTSTLQIEERLPGRKLERKVVETNVTISKTQTTVIAVNETYHMNWNTYHTVEVAEPKTITMIHIHRPYYAGNMRFILDPKNIASTLPDGWEECSSAREAFKDTMYENTCWEIIAEILK